MRKASVSPPETQHQSLRLLVPKGLLRCAACGSAMLPRTIKKENREEYRCHGHIEGGEDYCTMKPAPRSAIDAAALAYFQSAALDLEAMRTELTESLQEQRKIVADQVEDAEHEAARGTAKMKRVRGDYQAGNLEAEDYQEQYAELREQQKAADARLSHARDREAELADAESHATDPENKALDRMKSIREAVA